MVMYVGDSPSDSNQKDSPSSLELSFHEKGVLLSQRLKGKMIVQKNSFHPFCIIEHVPWAQYVLRRYLLHKKKDNLSLTDSLDNWWWNSVWKKPMGVGWRGLLGTQSKGYLFHRLIEFIQCEEIFILWYIKVTSETSGIFNFLQIQKSVSSHLLPPI